MIRMQTKLDVADNTGAKKVSCIGVLGRSGKEYAVIGDIITCNVKEASPDAAVKAGGGGKAGNVPPGNPINRGGGVLL